MEAVKRPFCNAFTGCGKKRSSVDNTEARQPQTSSNELSVDESFSDASAETALEDLIRQIMTEARLWDALQEANREIMLQKQQYNNNKRPYSTTSRL